MRGEFNVSIQNAKYLSNLTNLVFIKNKVIVKCGTMCINSDEIYKNLLVVFFSQ